MISASTVARLATIGAIEPMRPWSMGGEAQRQRCAPLTLVHQQSATMCILNQTYGCYDQTVAGNRDFWVTDGCRGRFRCGAEGMRSRVCGNPQPWRKSNLTACWCSDESAEAGALPKPSVAKLYAAVDAPPLPFCIDVSRSEHRCSLYDDAPELCQRARHKGKRCSLSPDRSRCLQPSAVCTPKGCVDRGSDRRDIRPASALTPAEDGPVTFGVSYKANAPCVGHDGDPAVAEPPTPTANRSDTNGSSQCAGAPARTGCDAGASLDDDEPAVAQIDAAQLFSHKPLSGSDAPLRAFVAARGAARLRAGALDLTPRDLDLTPRDLTPKASGVGGGLAVHMPSAFTLRNESEGGGVAARPAFHFRARFRLYVGDGSGADGLSFCHGEVPLAGSLGERGSSAGLCVSFVSGPDKITGDHGRSREITIGASYDGVALRQRPRTPSLATFASVPECDADYPTRLPQCERAPPPPPPPLASQLQRARGSWLNVTVEVSRRGLQLDVDGATLFEAVELVGWTPLPSWGFAFGARTGIDDDVHRVDSLYIERGVSLEEQGVDVDLTLNGQQYTPVGHFTYHAHPVISSLTPPIGPTAGGTALTVSGMALRGAAEYRCRFALGSDPPLETPATFDALANGVSCPIDFSAPRRTGAHAFLRPFPSPGVRASSSWQRECASTFERPRQWALNQGKTVARCHARSAGALRVAVALRSVRAQPQLEPR